MTTNRTPTALEKFFMLLIRQSGTDLPQRPIANFLGATITDDPINNQTLITVGGVTIAVANLSNNFTQPAIGATVSAQVTSSTVYSVGLDVFINGGGYYEVTAIPDGTHLTLENLGTPIVNVAPSATVVAGPLVIPSGPPNLILEANGSAITQRQTLNFDGFVVTDDPVHGVTTVSNAQPGPRVVTGAVTLGPEDTWIELQAFNGTLTMTSSPVTGRIVRITHVPGGSFGGLLSSGGTVLLTGSSNLEDPQDRFGLVPGNTSPRGTVALKTDFITYQFAHNGSIWRCVN